MINFNYGIPTIHKTNLKTQKTNKPLQQNHTQLIKKTHTTAFSTTPKAYL